MASAGANILLPDQLGTIKSQNVANFGKVCFCGMKNWNILRIKSDFESVANRLEICFENKSNMKMN